MLNTKSMAAPAAEERSHFLGKVGYALLGMVAGALITVLLNGAFTWLLATVPTTKAPWYAVRSSGMLAYGLLWFSTVWGLLLSTRWFRKAGASLTAMHEFLSLLSLIFVLLHVITLHFDAYLHLSWTQILVPFLATAYRPLALGIGQVAFYLIVAIVLSFYVRRRIGNKRWRTLHYATFVVYGFVLVHAVAAGTDSVLAPMRLFYLLSGGVVLFLTYARILTRPTS